jgi:hypothetical protein
MIDAVNAGHGMIMRKDRIAGYCTKCGAPYYQDNSMWMGVTPPSIKFSCGCWSSSKTITTTTDSQPIGNMTLFSGGCPTNK